MGNVTSIFYLPFTIPFFGIGSSFAITGDMLSTLLKEQTKESHQQLEAVVVRQIKSIRSTDDYLRLLRKFYGYYAPLEKLFDKQLNDEIVPFYRQRQKAVLLLNDLKSLKVNYEVCDLANDIPVIDSRATALGSFYVLEGSSQGGEIVADMLFKYANLSNEHTSFFRVYGQDKKAMWIAFINQLNQIETSEDFNTQIVKSANDTFQKFRN